MKRSPYQAFALEEDGVHMHETAEMDMEMMGKSGVRACVDCGATNTPQWRQGPSGPKTLCNACGVRYSRLVRRGSKPGKRKPVAQDSSGSDVSVSEDTSKGTVLLMPPPLAANSPVGSPPRSHPFQAACLVPFIAAPTPAPETCTTPGSMRAAKRWCGMSGIPTEVVQAPLSPMTSSARTLGGKRASSNTLVRMGSSSATLPRVASPAPRVPHHPVPEDNVDCEAALNLLSMAAGTQISSMEVQQPDEHHSRPEHPTATTIPAMRTPARTPRTPRSPAPVAAVSLPPVCHAYVPPKQLQLQEQQLVCSSLAAAQGIHAKPGAGALSGAGGAAGPLGQDVMQVLMENMNEEERQKLRQLCALFDASFQEMVAAHAACEAVSQILQTKQEAARQAQLAARSAAQLLLMKATELTSHQSVAHAISQAQQQARVAADAAVRSATASAGSHAQQQEQDHVDHHDSNGSQHGSATTSGQSTPAGGSQ